MILKLFLYEHLDLKRRLLWLFGKRCSLSVVRFSDRTNTRQALPRCAWHYLALDGFSCQTEHGERENKTKHHLSPLFSLRNPHGDLTVDPAGFHVLLKIILFVEYENCSCCLSIQSRSPSLWNPRGDLTVNPSSGLSNLVVDARLLVHRAPKPCARDPYQRPP